MKESITEQSKNELSLSEKLLEGIPVGDLEKWIEGNKNTIRDPRIIKGKKTGKESFDVFDIGPEDPEKVISIVKVLKNGEYNLHRHLDSDAVFVIISGQAILLTTEKNKLVKIPLNPGVKIEIPRGMVHGFEDDKDLKFLSVQSPPIKNTKTGKEDLEEVDITDLI